MSGQKEQIEKRLGTIRDERIQLAKEEAQLKKRLLKENEDENRMEDFRAYTAGYSREHIKWRRLDTSAIMYPLISGELNTNVYRISIVLKQEIQEVLLQEALNIVLPKFPLFNTRLRQGIHWYYLEENGQPAPSVVKENTYPCQVINMQKNRNYLFRVTYFRRRINLEVYHVLTDGLGAGIFIRELVYQYLRLAVPSLGEAHGDTLSASTSLNTENRFWQNYEKQPLRPYRYEEAYQLKEAGLPRGQTGILTGMVSVNAVREAARRHRASVNEYLVAAMNYAVYENRRHSMRSGKPIITCVPVNMRPYLKSVATSNLFVNVFARFVPDGRELTFDDVLRAVQESLHSQINQEHLEELFSRNISSADNLLSRMIPMVFKRLYLKHSYNRSVKGTTMTVSNLGSLKLEEEYAAYVERFVILLSRAKGQGLKLCIASYKDEMALSFTSAFKSAAIPETFFRFLVKDGVGVAVETNGVYYR